MAMQVGATAEGEPLSEINTTPLIDVMLVLLIMLIITIPPQRHAVKLDTPRPPPPDAPPPPENPIEPVRIQVDFDGSYYWNGSPIDRPTMERQMTVEAQRSEQPEIHIEPHRLAQYERVAGVMASAQRLGLTKLGIIGGTQ
ncbi:MAG: biopolymer transporter ExbD [Alphaproteobacteria bacterium]|mgnify:CR=1 FL=1|nr:biopolymer transporter ExbD [Alphaproteobacteria bacterium]